MKLLIVLFLFLVSSPTTLMQVSAHGPNLFVNNVYAAVGSYPYLTTILPRLNETFYVYAIIGNSGDQYAKNFTLKLDVKWQGGNGETPQRLNIHFPSLNAGTVEDSIKWGPFLSSQPSNLTLTVTINPNRTVTETDYSDNTITMTIKIGDLFNSVNGLLFQPVWQVTEDQTMSSSGESYQNSVYGTISSDSTISLIRTDGDHSRILEDGKQIYETSNRTQTALSPSGRYLVLSGDVIQVFDLKNNTKNPAFSIQLDKVNMSLTLATAISNDGVLALAGESTTSKRPNKLLSLGYVTEIDMKTGRALWTEDFDADLLNFGPNYANVVSSLTFDGSGELLVGVASPLAHDTSYSFARFYAPFPRLFLFHRDGSLAWKTNLSSSVWFHVAISANGNAVMAPTEYGTVHFFDLIHNSSFTLYQGFDSEKVYSPTIPFAISPEGDCVAVSDRANVYLLDTAGTPLFKMPMTQVTSLSMAGGFLLVSRIGGAAVTSLWEAVNDAMTKAEVAISTAQANGADTTEAELLLAQATSARGKGDWYQAYSTATQAGSAAQQARPRILSTTASTSPTSLTTGITQVSPSFVLPILLAILIAGVVAGIVVVKRHKRR